MEHHESLPFLREALLFLGLAGILIPLLQRFRINQVLGFLTVGLLVGPHGVALWVDEFPWLANFTFPREEGVQALAELGVIFLMFLIGLELSAQRMWAMRRWVFAGGLTQVLVSALLIGALAAYFGNDAKVAVVLGLVLSLSSTAVVIQLLSQQRALASPMGQATFGVLMLQDLAVVPVLILVDLLARPSTEGMGMVVGLTLLKSVATVAIIFVVGRRVVGPLFRGFARQHQPEVFMALILLVTLGIAAVTAKVGLSMAMGAFLAGLLLSETEYRHEVEVTVEPFKGLLMGLFFMTVGMGIDVRLLGTNGFWLISSVIGLMAIKAAVAMTVFRIGRLSWGRSLEGGLLLSQGGEFAFIVVGVAATTGLIDGDIAQFMLLVVSLSLMATPPLARLGRLLGERLDKAVGPHAQLEQGELVDADLRGHVVIAGFGRVGQLLAGVLENQGVPYVAIEHDAHVAYRLRAEGRPVFYGNAAKPELLRKLHTSQAALLLVTMDQPGAAMHTVRAARADYPQLPIFARSRDEQHARELRQVGATAVVPETLEAGLQLSSFALHTLGLPESDIISALEAERDRRVHAH